MTEQLSLLRPPRGPQFSGSTYSAKHDQDRLGHQLNCVLTFMLDGAWHTPEELEMQLGFRWASISARLRDLRKEEFGSFLVERRADKWARERGMFQYRVKL